MNITKEDFKNFNLLRVATVSPKIHLGNVRRNLDEIISYFPKFKEDNIDIAVFPELSLTGYTNGDLFFQNLLIEKAKHGILELVELSEELNTIIIVGYPFVLDSKLFNAAAVIFGGELCGIVLKTHLSNSREYYEERWFTSSREVDFNGYRLSDYGHHAIGNSMVFEVSKFFDNQYNSIKFGVEICEDLWAINPPSNDLALSGAEVIFNLSTSSELVGKSDFRRDLVRMQSAKTISAYVYCSSSSYESSTDMTFAGHNIIAENGKIIKESKRFDLNGSYIYTDIDLDVIRHDRRKNHTFARSVAPKTYMNHGSVFIEKDEEANENIENYVEIERIIARNPFVPQEINQKNQIIESIIDIQTNALISKLLKINKDIYSSKIVIGVSGGLDSTLALLVAKNAFDKLEIKSSNIYAITMPGFGTTDRTYNNALKLARYLSLTLLEIPIKDAVVQHFKDIEHDENDHNIVYENAQARERTQILMDYANKVGGIVIGTADLSEMAVGWCTFNADHISMYNINGGVPKTLVKEIVSYFAETVKLYNPENKEGFSEILNDIVTTEVSPELLPSDGKKIIQKTEDIIGPYELIDFFMFYILRYGFKPSKVLLYAEIAFAGEYDNETLKKWLKVFIKRFFSSQFKRNMMPDTVKIGSIALSPRGDWRMPSEVDYQMWLDDLEEEDYEINV